MGYILQLLELRYIRVLLDDQHLHFILGAVSQDRLYLPVINETPDDLTAFQCKVVCLVHLGRFEDVLTAVKKNSKFSGYALFLSHISILILQMQEFVGHILNPVTKFIRSSHYSEENMLQPN